VEVAVKGEFPSEVLAKGRAKTKGEKVACSAPAEARNEPGGGTILGSHFSLGRADINNQIVSWRFSKKRGHGKQLGVRNNQTEYRTMTRKKSNRTLKEIKAMMGEDDEFLRPMVHAVIRNFWKRRWRKPWERRRGNESKGD
jgi:hypothetical protein